MSICCAWCQRVFESEGAVHAVTAGLCGHCVLAGARRGTRRVLKRDAAPPRPVRPKGPTAPPPHAAQPAPPPRPRPRPTVPSAPPVDEIPAIVPPPKSDLRPSVKSQIDAVLAAVAAEFE